MELEDRLEVGRVAGKARLGDDVLTAVVTLGGAVPEEKAAVEGCRDIQFTLSLARRFVCSYEWTVRRHRSLCGCSPTANTISTVTQGSHRRHVHCRHQRLGTHVDAALELRLAIAE